MKLGDGSWQMGVAMARGKRLPSWSAVAVTPLLRTGSRLKMTGTLRTFQTRLQSGVAPRFPPHSKIWRRYGWFMEGDIPPECPRPDGWASRSYPQLLLLEAENPKNSIFRTRLTSGWVKPDPKKAEFEVNRVEAEAKSPEAVVKRAGFDAKKVESDAKRLETGLISVETDLKRLEPKVKRVGTEAEKVEAEAKRSAGQALSDCSRGYCLGDEMTSLKFHPRLRGGSETSCVVSYTLIGRWRPFPSRFEVNRVKY